jgi:hypothetical protein
MPNDTKQERPDRTFRDHKQNGVKKKRKKQIRLNKNIGYVTEMKTIQHKYDRSYTGAQDP